MQAAAGRRAFAQAACGLLQVWVVFCSHTHAMLTMHCGAWDARFRAESSGLLTPSVALSLQSMQAFEPVPQESCVQEQEGLQGLMRPCSVPCRIYPTLPAVCCRLHGSRSASNFGTVQKQGVPQKHELALCRSSVGW